MLVGEEKKNSMQTKGVNHQASRFVVDLKKPKTEAKKEDFFSHASEFYQYLKNLKADLKFNFNFQGLIIGVIKVFARGLEILILFEKSFKFVQKIVQDLWLAVAGASSTAKRIIKYSGRLFLLTIFAPFLIARWFFRKIFNSFSKAISLRQLFKKPNKSIIDPRIIGEKIRNWRHYFYFKKSPAKEEILLEEIFPEKFSIKRILKFTFLLVLIILPFKFAAYFKTLDLGNLKSRVVRASSEGINNLIGASQSAMQMDFVNASGNFSQAQANFSQAQKDLAEINDLIFSLAKYVPAGDVKLAAYSKQIVAVGQSASQLGEDFSLAFGGINGNNEKNLAQILDDFTVYGGRAKVDATNLEQALSEIDPAALPEEARDKFKTLKEKTSGLAGAIDDFLALTEKLKDFAGVGGMKRYLLVFQNNSEMRASGGFIGSFAQIDFINGQLVNVKTPPGGSYDTAGGMRALVTAPQPLWIISPLWHFWDANWWADWPTTARKLMWFYEKSDGPTVDGVISFTPTVLEKILKVTGPIDMTAKYGIVINADNFYDTVQRIVEAPNLPNETASTTDITVDKERPKQIISDMMDQIIKELPERVKDREKLLKLLEVMQSSLKEKHILFYFSDANLEQEVEKRGWSGELAETNHDYLSVINTNILGQKSDRAIKETISQTTEVAADGSVIDSLTIRRKHTAIRGELFTGVRNLDWLRIYVPAGSELISANGFSHLNPNEYTSEQPDDSWQIDPEIAATEGRAITDQASGTKIYQENGKTVFANWLMVEPGEEIIINLKYKLPFVLKPSEVKSDRPWWEDLFVSLGLVSSEQKSLIPYSLLVQKQPGSNGSDFSSVLNLPINLKAVWKYPDMLSASDSGWRANDILATDKYYAIVLEK